MKKDPKQVEHSTDIVPARAEPEVRTGSGGYMWQAANLMSKIMVTSGAVSIATQPIKALELKLLQHQRAGFIGLQGGKWAAVRALYQGLPARMVAGQKRGFVTLYAKNSSKHVEEIPTEGSTSEALVESKPGERGAALRWYQTPAFAISCFSQAEIAVTQPMLNKSSLQSAGILGQAFRWNPQNFKQLMLMAYPFKTAGGLLSYAGICVYSDYVARSLHFNNENLNHLLGGAITGAATAVIKFPADLAANTVILNSKMHEGGSVQRMTTLGFFKQQAKAVSERGVKQCGRDFARIAMRQLPVSIANSIVLYGLIQGIDHLMGEEPLSQFSPNPKQ